MGLLVRKINRAKWHPSDDFQVDELPADAITVDLKTSSNSLSMWLAASTSDADLADVALALSSCAERLDKMDIIWISIEAVEAAGLGVDSTLGRTPIKSLRDKHRDIVRLDYTRLGTVGKLVKEALVNERYKRYSKKDIAGMLLKAIEIDQTLTATLNAKLVADLTEYRTQSPK